MLRSSVAIAFGRRGLVASAVLAVALAVAPPARGREAHGSAGAVVAAENVAAAEIGLAVLDEGGSAVDAAIAASLAGCVVHSASCGIGGGGFMVIWDARTGRAFALDYRETAPGDASSDQYLEGGKYDRERSRAGALAVGVPGEIAGLAAAHARFGRLPWSRLVQPSIDLARDGIPITPHLARALSAERERIRADPELAALLLHADGSAPAAGELVKMPALASTLQAIADRGPAAFYRGPVAKAIAETVQAKGGSLRESDLAGYTPIWREPLRATYRGAAVYTMSPPSAGGTALVLALETLSGFDVAALGADSAERWHVFAEILKHAFADRARYAGDPAFDSPAPPPDAAALRKRISLDQTHSPDFYGTTAPAKSDSGTAHVSVIAADGSAAAATSTINTSFGALLGARGAGVILNNELDDFSFPAPNLFGLAPGTSNRIAAGKRPASSMTPTVAVRDGKAVVAVGASGGPLIISATLEVLTNVIDFAMPAEAAVAAPRVHHQWQPNVLLVEPGIGAPTRDALAHLGHEIREIPEGAAVSLATALPGAEAAGAGDARKGGAARTRSTGDRSGDQWQDGAPANPAERSRVQAQP